MPQKEAGPRIEPPVSEPSAPAHRPAATATGDPELAPAGTRERSHGFRPVASGPAGIGRPNANSCMLSLPRRTAPAAANRSATKASRSGTWPARTCEPAVIGGGEDGQPTSQTAA